MIEQEQRKLTGVHVLAIDDNEDARDVLDHYLTYHGALVTTAAGGDEALAVLARIQVDVIVSDLSMPGLDGFELIELVRTLRGHHSTPAIAVTALNGDHNRRRALESGFQIYLVKPIDPLALVREIERLVPEARAGDS